MSIPPELICLLVLRVAPVGVAALTRAFLCQGETGGAGGLGESLVQVRSGGL